MQIPLAEQIEDALWKFDTAGVPRGDRAGLVVAGMGGSAIGGRLAVGAIGPRAVRPVVLAAGYDLPAWVGEGWTVLCSSYSGATEETLACYERAGERGAARVVATTGGELAERARADRVPVIPAAGGFQPREAVGYALVAALETAAACGAAPSLRGELEAATRAAAPEAPAELVDALAGGVAVVHGAELTAAVAYRWKTQLNENAGVHAFASELPEADHNEIEAWASGGPFAAVFLDDPDTHPRTRRRIEVTREVIGGGHVVAGRGATRTERLLDLVALGDAVSLAVAERLGADAQAIPAIDRLKAELAG